MLHAQGSKQQFVININFNEIDRDKLSAALPCNLVVGSVSNLKFKLNWECERHVRDFFQQLAVTEREHTGSQNFQICMFHYHGVSYYLAFWYF